MERKKTKKIKKDPLEGCTDPFQDIAIKIEEPEDPLASEKEEESLISDIKLEVTQIAAADYSDEEDVDVRVEKKKINPWRYKYKCPHCDSKFTSKLDHSQHIYRVHVREGDHRCKHCKSKFKSIHSLRRHARLHTGEDLSQCEVCKKMFTSVGILNTHMATVHANGRLGRERKTYSCPHCTKVITSKYSFEKHLTVHTNERPFACSLCPGTFKHRDGLEKHQAIHTKPFVCKDCGKGFSANHCLLRHMNIHLEKKLKCPYCVYKFALAENLRTHVDQRHPGLPHELIAGPVRCTVCNEIYENMEVLLFHVKIHPVVKNFECHLCGQKFVTKKYLIKHIDFVHLLKRQKKRKPAPPKTCSECGKKYTNPTVFRRHKCDTTVKPFPCTQCRKSFTRKTTLELHSSMHKEKRPEFSCPECQMVFHWRASVRQHMLKKHGKNLVKAETAKGIKVVRLRK
ncbi:gastrula zinc finger protein XlCGF57.1-like [Phlebotomus argentipes]|uniref:gastrula zinc finger protein XlCGF57.1-like n=1 Tax=Phlebotomus argentipes TaxID=94469 RepID=UPI002892C753|nr:gastrula zinc finger protein XlCGF57.1-like [Phlebotomus argentipes]